MKEKDLSISLGLTREVLKDLRSKFVEGEDWMRVECNKPKHLWNVEWSLDGIDKLKAEVGFKPEEEITKCGESKGVIKGRYKNSRIVQVEIDGKDVNVVCRDNSKFIAGMPVWIKWDGSRWAVSRHPRFNGKY
jgi:hypothetical protein